MLKLLMRKIIQSILIVIFYSIYLRRTIVSFVQIRVLKQHTSYKQYGSGVNYNLSKIIIIFIYPRKPLLPSIDRFITFVIAQDFHPIIVLNESKQTESFLSQLSRFQESATFLTRKNIGRDFGGYQCAISYLSKQISLEKIGKLAFFNDSIVYGTDFEWFRELDSMKSDINCLYSNFQFSPHFQSMAFMCNSNVISSSEFKAFWKDYYPSGIRKKVIKNGEIEFSKTLTRAGFQFNDLATEILKNGVEDMTKLELQSLLMFALDTAPQKNFIGQILTIPDFPISQDFEITEVMRSNLVNLVATSSNLSHAMGGYFSRKYNFPLKLDLMKFGTVGILDVQNILKEMNLSADEILELKTMLRVEGSFYSLRGWQKLFREYGVI